LTQSLRRARADQKTRADQSAEKFNEPAEGADGPATPSAQQNVRSTSSRAGGPRSGIPPKEYLALLHPLGSRGVAFLCGPEKVAPTEDAFLNRDCGIRFASKKVYPAEIVEAGWAFATTNRGKKRYVTMNRFSTWRNQDRLLELNCTYVDLDYYKTETYRDQSPEEILEICFSRCTTANVPHPNLVTFSGRGLLLVWLHSPAPAAALPRWNAIQEELQKIFYGLGVDGSGKTCTKVFRIPGSSNNKKAVRVIFPQHRDDVVRFNFDNLAKQVLPVSRSGVGKNGTGKRCRRSAKGKISKNKKEDSPSPDGDAAATSGAPLIKLHAGDRNRANGTKTVSPNFQPYWQEVQNEVNLIRHFRYGKRFVDEGERDLFCFILSVCASHLVAQKELLSETVDICARVAGWRVAEARSMAASVLARAKSAAEGKKIAWKGKQCDPRYRMKGTTIARFLNVKPEEVDRLRLVHVAPEEVKAERAREAVKKHRKKMGVKTRDERRAEGHLLAEKVIALNARKISFKNIAATLKISVGRAHSLAREHKTISQDQTTNEA